MKQVTKEALSYMTVNVDNEEYYACDIFAELTDRSPQAVRLLILKGNRIRKLKAITVGPTILVKKSELTEFPFTCAGRAKLVIRYDAQGNERTSYSA